MAIPHHQIAGQHHNTKVSNKFFENVAKIKNYLGMTVNESKSCKK
jgi:hypothetical protein